MIKDLLLLLFIISAIGGVFFKESTRNSLSIFLNIITFASIVGVYGHYNLGFLIVLVQTTYLFSYFSIGKRYEKGTSGVVKSKGIVKTTLFTIVTSIFGGLVFIIIERANFILPEISIQMNRTTLTEIWIGMSVCFFWVIYKISKFMRVSKQ